MNRLALVLAAATLAFTTAAVHFARELKQEQARNPQQAASASLQAAAQPAIAPDTVAPATVAQNTAASAVPAANLHDPAALAIARHRLDQLLDPSARAEQVRQRVESSRQVWQVIAPQIGLAPAELDRVLEQLADRTLTRQQRRLECRLDPACDVRPLTAAVAAEGQQDQAEVLGPEMQARYQAFMDSNRERGQVEILRTRLTGNDALSEATAAALAVALAEERRRVTAETSQKYPQGAAYTQRLLDRAAGVLTAGQLAQFRSMQDAQLASAEEVRREREIGDSARRAAGHAP